MDKEASGPDFVLELARAKMVAFLNTLSLGKASSFEPQALSVPNQVIPDLVISADTSAQLEDGTVIGKPVDSADAFRIISLCSFNFIIIF